MTADVRHTQLIKHLETFAIGLFFTFIISLVNYIELNSNTLIYLQIRRITKFNIHFHFTNDSTAMIERHIIQFSFMK